MAEVYLADDLQLGRQVAVKVLQPKHASDPKAVERFRREARAAAALDHPSLVTAFDWGIDEGRAFLVMQYVAGSGLEQVIRKRGPLAELEALRLAADKVKDRVRWRRSWRVARIEDFGKVLAQDAPEGTVVQVKGRVGSACRSRDPCGHADPSWRGAASLPPRRPECHCQLQLQQS